MKGLGNIRMISGLRVQGVGFRVHGLGDGLLGLGLRFLQLFRMCLAWV